MADDDKELPEKQQPDMEQPDKQQPDKQLPKEQQPDMEQPEKKQPDKQLPEKQQPDKQQPDMEQPDKQQPDKQLPEKQQPDKQLPEKQQPDKQLPEKQQPDMEQPDKQQPDKQLPEKQQPEMQPLEKQEPDMELPEKQQPNKQLPEKQLEDCTSTKISEDSVLSVVPPSSSSLSIAQEVQFDIYREISQLDQQSRSRPILQIHDEQQLQSLEPEPTKLTSVVEPEPPVLVPAKSSHSRSGRGATNINHLPNRLLAKIIELLLDNQHDQLKEVSPHWNTLIDRHIGIPIILGRFSEFLESSESFEFGSPETIAEKGISSCYFSNIHHVKLPAFKYPNLVRKVTFLDYVSEGCFRKLLGPLSNLRRLELDLSSIHYLEFENISLDFLPRLEHVQISNGEYSSTWNDEVNPSRNEVHITLDNTFSLLQENHIPNLKILIIDFPVCSPDVRNGDFVVAVFRCLLNHAETIKTLEIYFIGEVKALDDDEIEIPTGVLAEFDIDKLSALKLRNFVINLQKEHRLQDLVHPWLGLLSTQTELRNCSFLPRNTDDDEVVELPLPTEVITTNAETLRVFKWYLEEDWASRVPATISCNIFETCVHLEELHLAASGSIPSKLTNVTSIPSTIRTLCIEGIHMDKEDVEAVTTGLPNLRKLSLASIGQVGGNGMTIATLKGIFDRKTLHRLVINYGFNLESLRFAPAENNSFSFILMLIKNKFADEDDSYFHMQLCENGLEYAVKP